MSRNESTVSLSMHSTRSSRRKRGALSADISVSVPDTLLTPSAFKRRCKTEAYSSYSSHTLYYSPFHKSPEHRVKMDNEGTSPTQPRVPEIPLSRSEKAPNSIFRNINPIPKSHTSTDHTYLPYTSNNANEANTHGVENTVSIASITTNTQSGKKDNFSEFSDILKTRFSTIRGCNHSDNASHGSSACRHPSVSPRVSSHCQYGHSYSHPDLYPDHQHWRRVRHPHCSVSQSHASSVCSQPAHIPSLRAAFPSPFDALSHPGVNPTASLQSALHNHTCAHAHVNTRVHTLGGEHAQKHTCTSSCITRLSPGPVLVPIPTTASLPALTSIPVPLQPTTAVPASLSLPAVTAGATLSHVSATSRLYPSDAAALAGTCASPSAAPTPSTSHLHTIASGHPYARSPFFSPSSLPFLPSCPSQSSAPTSASASQCSGCSHSARCRRCSRLDSRAPIPACDTWHLPHVCHSYSPSKSHRSHTSGEACDCLCSSSQRMQHRKYPEHTRHTQHTGHSAHVQPQHTPDPHRTSSSPTRVAAASTSLSCPSILPPKSQAASSSPYPSPACAAPPSSSSSTAAPPLHPCSTSAPAVSVSSSFSSSASECSPASRCSSSSASSFPSACSAVSSSTASTSSLSPAVRSLTPLLPPPGLPALHIQHQDITHLSRYQQLQQYHTHSHQPLSHQGPSCQNLQPHAGMLLPTQSTHSIPSTQPSLPTPQPFRTSHNSDVAVYALDVLANTGTTAIHGTTASRLHLAPAHGDATTPSHTMHPYRGGSTGIRMHTAHVAHIVAPTLSAPTTDEAAPHTSAHELAHVLLPRDNASLEAMGAKPFADEAEQVKSEGITLTRAAVRKGEIVLSDDRVQRVKSTLEEVEVLRVDQAPTRETLINGPMSREAEERQRDNVSCSTKVVLCTDSKTTGTVDLHDITAHTADNNVTTSGNHSTGAMPTAHTVLELAQTDPETPTLTPTVHADTDALYTGMDVQHDCIKGGGGGKNSGDCDDGCDDCGCAEDCDSAFTTPSLYSKDSLQKKTTRYNKDSLQRSTTLSSESSLFSFKTRQPTTTSTPHTRDSSCSNTCICAPLSAMHTPLTPPLTLSTTAPSSTAVALTATVSTPVGALVLLPPLASPLTPPITSVKTSGTTSGIAAGITKTLTTALVEPPAAATPESPLSPSLMTPALASSPPLASWQVSSPIFSRLSLPLPLGAASMLISKHTPSPSSQSSTSTPSGLSSTSTSTLSHASLLASSAPPCPASLVSFPSPPSLFSSSSHATSPADLDRPLTRSPTRPHPPHSPALLLSLATSLCLSDVTSIDVDIAITPTASCASPRDSTTSPISSIASSPHASPSAASSSPPRSHLPLPPPSALVEASPALVLSNTSPSLPYAASALLLSPSPRLPSSTSSSTLLCLASCTWSSSSLQPSCSASMHPSAFSFFSPPYPRSTTHSPHLFFTPTLAREPPVSLVSPPASSSLCSSSLCSSPLCSSSCSCSLATPSVPSFNTSCPLLTTPPAPSSSQSSPSTPASPLALASCYSYISYCTPSSSSSPLTTTHLHAATAPIPTNNIISDRAMSPNDNNDTKSRNNNITSTFTAVDTKADDTALQPVCSVCTGTSALHTSSNHTLTDCNRTRTNANAVEHSCNHAPGNSITSPSKVTCAIHADHTNIHTSQIHPHIRHTHAHSNHPSANSVKYTRTTSKPAKATQARTHVSIGSHHVRTLAHSLGLSPTQLHGTYTPAFPTIPENEAEEFLEKKDSKECSINDCVRMVLPAGTKVQAQPRIQMQTCARTQAEPKTGELSLKPPESGSAGARAPLLWRHTSAAGGQDRNTYSNQYGRGSIEKQAQACSASHEPRMGGEAQSREDEHSRSTTYSEKHKNPELRVRKESERHLAKETMGKDNTGAGKHETSRKPEKSQLLPMEFQLFPAGKLHSPSIYQRKFDGDAPITAVTSSSQSPRNITPLWEFQRSPGKDKSDSPSLHHIPIMLLPPSSRAHAPQPIVAPFTSTHTDMPVAHAQHPPRHSQLPQAQHQRPPQRYGLDYIHPHHTHTQGLMPVHNRCRFHHNQWQGCHQADAHSHIHESWHWQTDQQGCTETSSHGQTLQMLAHAPASAPAQTVQAQPHLLTDARAPTQGSHGSSSYTHADALEHATHLSTITTTPTSACCTCCTAMDGYTRASYHHGINHAHVDSSHTAPRPHADDSGSVSSWCDVYEPLRTVEYQYAPQEIAIARASTLVCSPFAATSPRVPEAGRLSLLMQAAHKARDMLEVVFVQVVTWGSNGAFYVKVGWEKVMTGLVLFWFFLMELRENIFRDVSEYGLFANNTVRDAHEYEDIPTEVQGPCHCAEGWGESELEIMTDADR